MLSDPQPGKAARVRCVNRVRWGAPGRIAQSYIGLISQSYIDLISVLYWPSYIDLISILYRLFFFWFHIDCYAFAQHPRQFVQQLGLVSYGHAGVDVNSLTVVELPHAARFE